MKRLFLLSAAFAMSASMAMAITANDLVAAYQAEGYTKIEVITGLTQIKVEAVKGTAKVEVIYDGATGAVLAQENSFARRGDRSTGVELSSSSDDFLNGPGNDDGSDDDMDDDNGDDDGPNHDANDDDDANDDQGDDDQGHDDHGDDDDGKDDSSGHGKGGKDD